jgi:glycosyltransferase involved in cell wall biosynthesis
MHGVPVIAYGRGCIGEVVDAGSGLVVDTEVDFVPAAVKQIQAWITEPEAMRAASEHARGRFIAMRDEATRNWGQLFRELCA